MICHLNDAGLFISGLLSKLYKKMFKICEDDFYDSSPDPDCFGDYEESDDESEESPSKCCRLAKYDWVSLNKVFDTIGSLSQQYPGYLQL